MHPATSSDSPLAGVALPSVCNNRHSDPSLETQGRDCFGGCHCGNIHVRLRLTKPHEDNLFRACTCAFCRSHNLRMLSDPQGLLEVRADDWSLVERYRFGTRTCDFLICRRCGVFIAAVAKVDEAVRTVVNVNCLGDAHASRHLR